MSSQYLCVIVKWWAKFTTVRNCCLGIFMTFMTNGTCNGSLSWDWIFSDNDHVHSFAFCRDTFLVKCSLPRCLWTWQMTVPSFIWMIRGWIAPLAYSFKIWCLGICIIILAATMRRRGMNNAHQHALICCHWREGFLSDYEQRRTHSPSVPPSRMWALMERRQLSWGEDVTLDNEASSWS